MSAIAIIPARGGSTRVPGKNIKSFHGKPIIAYAIETARAIKAFRHIYVSTDSLDVAAVAKSYGADVLPRDPAYARDDVGTQEVMAYCLAQLGVVPAITCCIYATTPLMTGMSLVRGYYMLQRYTHLDYALSVGYPPLQDAGQFYWGRSAAFLERRPLISERTGLVYVPASCVCDINTPEDWARAEMMYAGDHYA